ncbi:MAG TPA: response regulator [Bryobacteraceae bacterium]|nr:response regulator [Bryobacteraceae bacterium]
MNPVTVLVVDDEPVVVTLAKTVLEREGYRVLIANDGQSAIALSKRLGSQIDVALLDYIMPIMNGSELARRLTDLQSHIAIVMMSGHSEEYITERGIAFGGYSFLPKPFGPANLRAAVQVALKSHGIARMPKRPVKPLEE